MSEAEVNAGAAPPATPAAPGNPAPPPPEPSAPATPPDAGAQAELERQIAKALSEFKAAELPKLLEGARSEAERVAKMDAEQKAEYERQTKEADYNSRLSELTRRELRIEAHKTLAEKGLPAELLDALNYSDEKACRTSLEAVEKAVRAGIEAGVNRRLQAETPKKAEPQDADAAVKSAVFSAFGIK